MFPLVKDDLHICPIISSQTHGLGKIKSEEINILFSGCIPARDGDIIQCQNGSQAVIIAKTACVSILNKRLACSADQSSHAGKLIAQVTGIKITAKPIFIYIGNGVEIGNGVIFG